MLAALGALAAALAGLLSAWPWLALPLALLVGAVLLRAPARPQAMLLQGRRAELADRAGGADLVDHALLGPWISLSLRADDGQRLHCLYGPGNLEAEVRRRLRVHLRRLQAAQP